MSRDWLAERFAVSTIGHDGGLPRAPNGRHDHGIKQSDRSSDSGAYDIFERWALAGTARRASVKESRSGGRVFEALLFGSSGNDRERKIPAGTLDRTRYGQHSLEGYILGKYLTLYPAKRENYLLTGLKADPASKNIGEQKREPGTVSRFDDAMSYRVKTFDLPLQVTPFWLGR
jgi:hypothetical protein